MELKEKAKNAERFPFLKTFDASQVLFRSSQNRHLSPKLYIVPTNKLGFEVVSVWEEKCKKSKKAKKPKEGQETEETEEGEG